MSRRLDGGEPGAEAPASPVPERILSRTGGKLLVDQLAVHGVDTIFCVPGESYLEVLDALYESPLRLITCRHEAGAANMADAYGKLTGRPGVCIVTRGPGATHASVGVHTAFQDSTPLILLVGQVGRDMLDREAFQEVDYRAMFGGLAKWAAQIDRAERVPEYLYRAFTTATSGRPGPVVLALPEDMQTDDVEAEDARPYAPVPAHPGADDLARLRDLLAGAKRPFAIVGGGGWSEQAAEDFLAFAEANELPVGASFRRQDYVDNASRVYAGHVGIGPDPKLAARVRDADLLLVVGARLGETTTSGYTLVEPGRQRQTLVHVHAAADELGHVYQPALGIVSGSPRVRGGGSGARACRLVGVARGDRAGACRPPREPAALGRPGRPPDGRGDGMAARAAARRRDPHERRRQLLGLGAPLLRVPALRHAARPDERRDGLRRACRRHGQVASTRIASSCASPATATS